jgi:hypothetical protein
MLGEHRARARLHRCEGCKGQKPFEGSNPSGIVPDATARSRTRFCGRPLVRPMNHVIANRRRIISIQPVTGRRTLCHWSLLRRWR